MQDKQFDPMDKFQKEQKKEEAEQQQQAQQPEQQYAAQETEEMTKWEMDTVPWIDRWYHELLGEIKNNDGAWEKAKNITPLMNEKGAHALSMMIYTRGNIHTQMSEFTIEDVKFMAADAGEDTAELLRDSWREWQVRPSKSIMNAITNMVFHMVYSLLLISLKGGMRKHREKRGMKIPMPVQQPQYPEPML